MRSLFKSLWAWGGLAWPPVTAAYCHLGDIHMGSADLIHTLGKSVVLEQGLDDVCKHAASAKKLKCLCPCDCAV